jgi:hypothetical protein
MARRKLVLEFDAGESFIVKAPLIDADTNEEILASAVAEAWVKIGTGITKTLTVDSEVTVSDGYILVNLPPAQTTALDGRYPVFIKVKTTAGEYSSIVKDETVKFEQTLLSGSY